MPFITVTDFALEKVSERGDQSEPSADTLYQSCELSACRGEVVLLLGPSGGGKSLLTKFLLGVVSPVSETLIVNGGDERRKPSMVVRLSQGKKESHQEVEVLDALYPEALRDRVGVMFQSLGLLEDLTAAENLAFANDQSTKPKLDGEWRRWREDVFKRLNLKMEQLDEPLSKRSGGERQRIALARMLAYTPEVMIFDEPTAALDPLSAREAVTLIREAHDESGAALTLVITHDYHSFLPVADRVWFLTPGREFINEQPPRSAEEYEHQLSLKATPASRPLPYSDRLDHEARVADRLSAVALTQASGSAARGLKSLKSPWFRRYLRTFAQRVIVHGLPFHLLAGLGLGAVATYFSFTMELGSVTVEGVGDVQTSRFVLPTFFEQMLSGFGVVLYRALIPLFTCICVAARAGTAITAYLSEMRDEGRQQWDAMESFGVPPAWFFLPQLLIVFSVGCFVLSYVAFWLASLGSLLTALATNPLCTFYTWTSTYWASLHPMGWLWFDGTGLFIVKTMTAGICIALISFIYGTKKKRSSLDTMTNLSRANVMSVLVTLAVFFVFLILETQP